MSAIRLTGVPSQSRVISIAVTDGTVKSSMISKSTCASQPFVPCILAWYRPPDDTVALISVETNPFGPVHSTNMSDVDRLSTTSGPPAHPIVSVVVVPVGITVSAVTSTISIIGQPLGPTASASYMPDSVIVGVSSVEVNPLGPLHSTNVPSVVTLSVSSPLLLQLITPPDASTVGGIRS